MDTTPASLTPAQISAKLRELVAEWLECEPEQIVDDEPLHRLGLDSLLACELAGEMERWLGIPVESELAYAFPTVAALAEETARRLRRAASEPASDATSATATAGDEPIAVVGMACRFPMARNPRQLWLLLRDGLDAVGRAPEERAGDTDATARWGGFLDDVAGFDPAFFDLQPGEAEAMDPQQRLFLEVAWEAFADAGYGPRQLAGSNTAVVVGACNSDYARLVAAHEHAVNAHYATGNLHAIIANRVSHVLDLQGPSLAVDTACSSALVALDLACEKLRSGACAMALVGGVNLILSDEGDRALREAGALAPDGRCRAFDAEACGFARSEGSAAVVLKPLSEARRDGDRIHALIRGSATNQDGRTPGLTTPSGRAQRQVIRQALQRAGVEPAEIDYVEAQATSIPLADVIELKALSDVLGTAREASSPCRVGSVKTNLGNLEAASGMAALLKVILSLQHEEIPAHLHLRNTHRDVTLRELSLDIPTQRSAWRRGERPRRAGVSSFALGGTNAHVIVEEAPPPGSTSASSTLLRQRPLELCMLSASTPAALRSLALRWAAHVGSHSVTDLCASAMRADTRQRFRATVRAATGAGLRRGLLALAQGTSRQEIHCGELETQAAALVFALPGEGISIEGRAAALYALEPSFRQAVDRCAAVLPSARGRLVVELLRGTQRLDACHDRLRRLHEAQFTLQYALGALLISWGLCPDRLVGRGLGEYVAAALSETMELRQALSLVSSRASQLASSEALRQLVEVVASTEQLGMLQRHVPSLRVRGPWTLHSTLVEVAPSELLWLLEVVRAHDLPARALPGAMEIALAGEMPGSDTSAGPEPSDAGLSRPSTPLTQLVGRLDPGARVIELASDGSWSLGPAESIGGGSSFERTWIDCLPDAWEAVIDALSQLYLLGVDADCQRYFAGRTRQRIAPPAPPFERRPHWLPGTALGARRHPLLQYRRELASCTASEPSETEQELDAQALKPAASPPAA